MSDLISRQSLLNSLNRFAPEHFNALVNDLIMKEPSVSFPRRHENDHFAEVSKKATQPDVPDTNVGDTISRQAAIDEIRRCRFVVDAIEKISKLPSAQPEQPKKGKWIPFDIPWYECSECGAVRENKVFMERYCPNCGARMEE